jgi:hypothetical protein
MYHCITHDLQYRDGGCPRCNAEERHRELVDTTFEAAERASYRQSNPGEYECPHCKYVSLRSDASRCPLCREHIDEAYWQKAHAAKNAAAERRRVQQEALSAEKEREQEAAALRAEIAKRSERNKRRTIVAAWVVAIAIATPFVVMWARQFISWIGRFSGGEICFGVILILVVIGLIGKIFE